MEDRNPWVKLSTQTVYENPWIVVEHHEVLNPAGGAGIYGKVHFKNLAIGILPLDENYHTWIVGQYRFALDTYSWEIPEGGCPKETSPLEAAQRELLEETGIQAGNWQKILELHTSNSVTDEFGMAFVATELSFGPPQPEDTELLKIKKIPFAELVDMVLSGEITDALSICTILKAQALIQLGKL